MTTSDKDLYFVAVKVFLRRGKDLLILKDNFGDWDLPGGRIKKDEFNASMESVVDRKMKQEIGATTKYTLGKPVVFFRHERNEAVEGNPLVRIFGIGYEAILESNEICLSQRHTEMKWVDVETFMPEEYFTGGWLKGLQEYLAMENPQNQVPRLLPSPIILRDARVITGSGRGEKMGIGTINVDPLFASHTLTHGVYACVVTLDAAKRKAAMHFGSRPVFKDSLSLEVHIIDGEVLTVPATIDIEIIGKIRDVQDFASKDDLLQRIKKDIDVARGMLETA